MLVGKFGFVGLAHQWWTCDVSNSAHVTCYKFDFSQWLKGPVWLLNVDVCLCHVLYFKKKTVIYKKKLIGLQCEVIRSQHALDIPCVEYLGGRITIEATREVGS